MTKRLVARFVNDKAPDAWMARWTDQTNCPALTRAIEQLEVVASPKFLGDVPYMGLVDGATDRPRYSFWATGLNQPPWDTDHRLETTLTGASNTPLSEWFDHSMDQLESCWSETPPDTN
jgi:hypothetical protein